VSVSNGSVGEPIELPWTDDTAFGGWADLRKSAGLPPHLRRFDDGSIGAVVVFSEHHTSYPRVVHGGIISVLVDQLMGDLLAIERGVLAFSATLRVRMLCPLVIGRAYRAVAVVRGEGFDVIHTEAEVTDEEHEVHVVANGTFRPIRSEQAREIMKLDDTNYQRLKNYFDHEVRQNEQRRERVHL